MLRLVVNIGGVKLYHAGDTDCIPEMKEVETDIALLPVSGTYVMSADEAIRAADVMHPKVAIPVDHGAIVGDKRDAVHFRDQLADKIDVVILEKVSLAFFRLRISGCGVFQFQFCESKINNVRSPITRPGKIKME